MVGLLVTGHGNFASGLLSAMELVAGVSDHIMGVDFLQSDSIDDLKGKLLEAVKALAKHGSEIIILADLAGGSPYNQSVMVKVENPQMQIEVLSGTNFPMVLAGMFEAGDQAVKELAESLALKGKENISIFAPVTRSQTIEGEDEDEGI